MFISQATTDLSLLKAMQEAISSSDIIEVKHQMAEQSAMLQATRSPVHSKLDNPKSYKVDELSQTIIPKTFSNNIAVAIQGNGNCLFNAMSMALCGNNILANCLRCLTAGELFVHSDAYVHHPLLENVAEILPGSDDASIFSSLLPSDAVDVFYDNEMDKALSIKQTALEVCIDKKHSTFISMLALSSVTQCHISSVYPEFDGFPLRPLFNNLIVPLHKTRNEEVVIMWSRDGNFDNRQGVAFTPNHFVLLIRGTSQQQFPFKMLDPQHNRS